jgi:hypothetical protein
MKLNFLHMSNFLPASIFCRKSDLILNTAIVRAKVNLYGKYVFFIKVLYLKVNAVAL